MFHNTCFVCSKTKNEANQGHIRVPDSPHIDNLCLYHITPFYKMRHLFYTCLYNLHHLKHLLRHCLPFFPFINLRLRLSKLLHSFQLFLCIIKPDMRVNIHRNADIRMPHQVLQRLRIHPGLRHIGTVSMSAYMWRNVRHVSITVYIDIEIMLHLYINVNCPKIKRQQTHIYCPVFISKCLPTRNFYYLPCNHFCLFTCKEQNRFSNVFRLN